MAGEPLYPGSTRGSTAADPVSWGGVAPATGLEICAGPSRTVTLWGDALTPNGLTMSENVTVRH